MPFLIDGYNVTRTDAATRDLDLESQRDALVKRLAARGIPLLGAGRIIVVFDGRSGAGASSERIGTVEVRYARERSADDEIVALVERSHEHIVLVTSDQGLVARVSGMAVAGLEVRPASACFEAAGHGGDRRGPKPVPRRDVGLPAGANEITRELKDLWLAAEGSAADADEEG